MASQTLQETLHETLTATTAAVASTTPSGVQSDPLMIGLAWFVGIVTLAIAVGKPIKDYLRSENRQDKVDLVGAAKSSAEAVLYNHLAEQVTEYRRIADEAFRERNALISRVAALEAKAIELDQSRALTADLQVRLAEKDAQIQALIAASSLERAEFLSILRVKDNEIKRLSRAVLDLGGVLPNMETELPDGELVG